MAMKLLSWRIDNDNLRIVLHMSREDLQRLGLVEKGESFKFSQFGKKFFRAYPHPKDLSDALERLINARRCEEKPSKAIKH